MIRVAQRGWSFDRPAETVADVSAGIGCHWVEINGVRIERIVRVEIVSDDDEVTLPRLVIEVADGVQIVYVDGNGDPLPGDPVPATRLPLTDHRTFVLPEDLHE